MDTVLDIVTVSAARQDLYNLIDKTAEEHRPIVIKGRRTEAVLVSREDWNSIQETMYLLSIPGMRESLIAAREEPLSEASDEPGW